MKVCVGQQAAPLVTGNYDFLDASASAPNNDYLGSFFWEGISATASSVASMRFSFGACDKYGNNVSLGFAAQDAAAAATGQASLSIVNCLSMPNNTTGVVQPIASFLSAQPTGVRLNLTNAPTTARLTNYSHVSGPDAEMECGNVQFVSGDLNKTITFSHLTGKPDIVWLLIAMGQTGGDNPGQGGSIGWYERLGGNMACSAFRLVSGANPTDICGMVSSSHAGEILSSSAVLADVTVDTVTSTGFRIHLSADPAAATLVGWIALRSTLGQLLSQSSVAAIPNATGNTALVTGLPAPGPICVMSMPGRFTVKDAFQRNDQAGHVGLCVASTADHTASAQASATSTFQSGVATSVGKNKNTLGRFMSTQADDGSDVLVGLVNSWPSDGITVSYNSVNASVIYAPTLAFGPAALNRTAFLQSGTYDITGAPSASDFAVNLDTGLYESVGENLSTTYSPVVFALDTGMYSINGEDAEFEIFIPTRPPGAPFPLYPVTSRQMEWAQLVRLAGGQTTPYPAEVYKFGGGAIQRSFYENV